MLSLGSSHPERDRTSKPISREGKLELLKHNFQTGCGLCVFLLLYSMRSSLLDGSISFL